MTALFAQALPAALSLPPSSLGCIGVALFLAYLVFGLTGFGASIVAMPLLTQVVTLRSAVPMMLVFDLVSASLLTTRNRSSVQTAELRRILPWILVGMVAGLSALMSLPERPLLLLLGLGILIYAGWKLLAPRRNLPLDAGWALPFGLLGGSFTALFGTGGPIYTIYLAGRMEDAALLRATVSALIVLTAVTRLLMFGLVGLYANPQVFALLLIAMPFALTGLAAGSLLRRRIAPDSLLRLLWWLLLASGLGLLGRVLAGTIGSGS